MVSEQQDYDLYDVLAELGWGMNHAPAASARWPSPTSTKLDQRLAETNRSSGARHRGQFEYGGTDAWKTKRFSRRRR